MQTNILEITNWFTKERRHVQALSSISTFLTSSDGEISSAPAILKMVEMVGCLWPRSNREMYVRSRSQYSASFSWERFLPSRSVRNTLPNTDITILSDFSQRKSQAIINFYPRTIV
jgi:hypothetical protein